MFKKALVCLAMFCSMPIYTEGVSFFSEKDRQQFEEINRDAARCNKLCIGKVLAKCVKSHQMQAECLDSDAITARSLCTDSINTDNLCANNINVNHQLCAPSFSSPMVCAEQVNATNFCASGLVLANAFQQCGKYRATVVMSTDTLYPLGTDIDFDAVIDDPDGDVTIAPMEYHAPLSGYYITTVQIDMSGLSGGAPVLGIPVANLQILVNGVVTRESFTPFLSFHNEQNTTITALMGLKAGDIVTMRYLIYIMSDVLGFTPYVGTIVIKGNGTEANNSIFKIHYLSSDCTSVPCTPCQPCTPTPCNVPCTPCATCCNMDCCEDND